MLDDLINVLTGLLICIFGLLSAPFIVLYYFFKGLFELVFGCLCLPFVYCAMRDPKPKVKKLAPLPKKRKRALTLPLPERNLGDRILGDVHWLKQNTCGQMQSRFFGLPLEVRLLVYEEIFAGGKHLIYEEINGQEQLKFHQCSRDPWEFLDDHACSGRDVANGEWGPSFLQRPGQSDHRWLLLSCRRM